ncbi:MAG: endopeptidase La [Gemmatimonadota bacterium]|nr:endopeptidase La [Gemmatimonadota bacterium]
MAELIRVDQPVGLPERLPVVALRDLVFFPYVVLPILVGRQRSLAALEEARQQFDDLVLLVAQKDPSVDDPDASDLFRVGTVARVVQMSKLPDGTSRVVLEGLGRARVERLTATSEALRATVMPLAREVETGEHENDPEVERLAGSVRHLYREYARIHERVPDELSETLTSEGDRVRFAHLVAGHVIVPSLEKQELLESQELAGTLELLRELLSRELEMLRIEHKLDRRLQMRLGGDDFMDLSDRAAPPNKDEPEEWGELEEQIRKSELPSTVRDRAEKELTRLRKLNPVAPEAAVIRNHLDWLVTLPWSSRSVDNLDVSHAADVLEAEHFGLGEVKDRILDHVAVLSLVREMRGPILCLVGPPGVGKTSLGRSIANALGREFVRVSLGGIRDEAEIRGHRRTYVGALPGRVVQGIRRGGTRNPVFLLDEVDKLARDFHGDPGAALLEVLDPEQNRTFTDHYLEVEFDLSDVLFIATANTLQDIPEPLRDRMEIIRLPGYLLTEKRQIATRYLWPRQLEGHGLDPSGVVLAPEAVSEIIERYTREAGVRELERRFSRIARKLARAHADDDAPTRPAVRREDLRELLGPPPYHPPDRDRDGDRVGIANGLAWTATGGEILDVEVAVVPGAGHLRLTGTLGDVMKESAQAAVTYARSRSIMLGLDVDFHERIDMHIHLPEGATPKDGPSAGITIAAALISALTERPTRSDVALTGEITLRGRVLGVGGVKEKAVAALRNGVRTVVLPAANVSDLELLPTEVTDNVRFEVVRTMDEVLDAVLTPGTAPPVQQLGTANSVDASVPHP